MALVLTSKGEIALLRNAVYSTGTPSRAWRMRLYKNSHTPVRSDTTATYTEADFLGYANAVISGWAAPVDTGTKALSSATPIVYTASISIVASQVVYGYYVTDDSDTNALLWAELFPDPIDIGFPLETLTVTPALTSTS